MPRAFRPVALVPSDTLERAIAEGWAHDAAAWKRWADDPGNACHRIAKGRL
jgi:hypothetical protein